MGAICRGAIRIYYDLGFYSYVGGLSYILRVPVQRK